MIILDTEISPISVLGKADILTSLFNFHNVALSCFSLALKERGVEESARRLCSLPVYSLPIPDRDDQDNKPVVMDFVDHTKGADSNSPGRSAGELLAA